MNTIHFKPVTPPLNTTKFTGKAVSSVAPKASTPLYFGREREWILPDRRVEALYSSCGSGDVELLRDLLEYVKKGQFEINGEKDDGGWSPVHIAAGHNNLEWIKVAHEEGGVDLWVKGGDGGKLPVDVARGEGFMDVVAYLEAQHAKGTANPSEKKKGWMGFCRKMWQGFQTMALSVGRVLWAPIRWLLDRVKGALNTPTG